MRIHLASATSRALLVFLLAPALALAQAGRHVPVPQQIVDEVKADSSVFLLGDESRDVIGRYLVAARVDLNGDGVPELQVRGINKICGMQNCVAWMYRRAAGGYERILKIPSAQTITVEATTSHGYRDVLTTAHGSAWDGGRTLYQYDGQRYRAVRCSTYSYRDVDARGVAHDRKTPRITPVACVADE